MPRNKKPRVNTTEDARLRLRATIEAQRLSRLGLANVEDVLKDAKARLRHSKGDHMYLTQLVSVLEERLEAKIESIMNEEPGGQLGGDCGGFSGGSTAGSD
jgi:hypothetical protein